MGQDEFIQCRNQGIEILNPDIGKYGKHMEDSKLTNCFVPKRAFDDITVIIYINGGLRGSVEGKKNCSASYLAPLVGCHCLCICARNRNSIVA